MPAQASAATACAWLPTSDASSLSACASVRRPCGLEAQSVDEDRDHPSALVDALHTSRRVTELSDSEDELLCADRDTYIAGGSCRCEQILQRRNEAPHEDRGQVVKRRIAGMQCRREALFGGHKLGQAIEPLLERDARRVLRGQRRGRLRAGIDLALEHRDNEVGTVGEVAIEGADPDAGGVGDLLWRGVDAGGGEHRFGGVEQGFGVASGIGSWTPLPAKGCIRSANRNTIPYSSGRAFHISELIDEPARPPNGEAQSMHYRSLGKTGIQVSPYALGAMMFGPMGNPDHDDAANMIHKALDAGINFIDTADRYSAGESEEIVGKALKGRRDDVVLATKVNGPMGEDPNQKGNSRRWIIAEVENSLRRLQTDYIDLYQIHRPDPETDIEETLSALTDLIRSGKVRAIGHSAMPASGIVEAQWAAERRGYERFRTEQPTYSILNRGIESEVLPVCERYGLGTDDLQCCNVLVRIPANPDYCSLNLAMSVQLLTYELFMAREQPRSETQLELPLAPAGDVEHFYQHLNEVMIEIDFEDRTGHLMERLRRLFNRAQMDRNELNILRGILSAIQGRRGQSSRRVQGV